MAATLDVTIADAAPVRTISYIPGLLLPVPVLLAGELVQMLGAVQQGVQTQEHRACVQQLLDLTA